ncbi:TPA: hypothetical protein ACMD15_003393 [Vibrio cholerae]
MSTLFDYAVNFKEKSIIQPVEIGFLKKVGVFAPPKTALMSEDGEGSGMLMIEDLKSKSKSHDDGQEQEPQLLSSPQEYVMFEATRGTYKTFTDNEDLEGFFDSGMNAVFILMSKTDAQRVDGQPQSKPLDTDQLMTICYSSSYSIDQAKTMLVDGFNGVYLAVTKEESKAEEFLAISENHFCFLDTSESVSGYGMCAAVGHHLTRKYWRNNQYFQPMKPEKVGGVSDSAHARNLLEKGVSFYIKDESMAAYLGFFGNKHNGIAHPYISEEVKLKSQESLTKWIQSREPVNTSIDIALAQRVANEPIRDYEQEPYRYLDPDYDNRVTISKSDTKYHASGDFEIKIPSPVWVFDIESTVVS